MRNLALQNTFQTSALECRWTYGMGIKSRAFQGFREYRVGFNGMEKDDEISGEGNSYDFGARIYDSRLGRWMSIDKQVSKFPQYSPYCAFINSPIYVMDFDGNVIIGTDGKAVVWAVVDGKYQFSKNADKLTQLYITGMNATDEGKIYLKKMEAPDIDVQIVYLSKEAVASFGKEEGKYTAGVAESKQHFEWRLKVLEKGSADPGVQDDFLNLPEQYTFNEKTGKSDINPEIKSFVIGINIEGIGSETTNGEDYILYSFGVADIKSFSDEFAKVFIATAVEESVHITQTEFDFVKAVKQDNGTFTEGAPIPYENRKFENEAHKVADKAATQYKNK